jgi:hypothetical protein
MRSRPCRESEWDLLGTVSSVNLPVLLSGLYRPCREVECATQAGPLGAACPSCRCAALAASTTGSNRTTAHLDCILHHAQRDSATLLAGHERSLLQAGSAAPEWM